LEPVAPATDDPPARTKDKPVRTYVDPKGRIWTAESLQAAGVTVREDGGSARTYVDPKGRIWTVEALQAAVATQDGMAASYAAILDDDPHNSFAKRQMAEAKERAEAYRRILRSIQ
jgi:streptogramin lyase